LLAHEGYDVAYLVFRTEEHGVLGVRGPGKTYGSSGYLFLETTNPVYVNEVPEELVGGITLRSEPWVIPIGEGTKSYGSADQVARILKAREKIPGAAQALADRMSSRPWTQAEWDKMKKQLDQAQNAYNLYLRGTPSKGEPAGHKKLKDRTEAVEWLDKYGWWE
jgi:hypothetical protein